MPKDILEVDETTGIVKGYKAEIRKRRDQALADEAARMKKERLARLSTMEDELLDEAGFVMRFAHRFAELEPGAQVPPPEWIDELGEKRAAQAMRIAQSAWMSAKEAPMALKLASSTVTAVMKARAAKATGEVPRLNIAVVQLQQPASAPVYPVLEVEK